MTSDEDLHYRELAYVADNVSLVSDHEYLVLGRKRHFTVAGSESSLDYPENSRFAAQLESDLYSQFYCRPSDRSTSPTDPLAHRDHLTALSEANCGIGAWESGWRVVEVSSSGQIAVRRDSVVFWVNRNGVNPAARNLAVGTLCRVRVAKEMRHLSPGYYFAIGNGDRLKTRDEQCLLLRVYWHLKAEAAVEYIARTTEMLNGKRIAFRTKVLSDPRSYLRADAGVLYIEQRSARRIGDLLGELYELMRGGLRESVPMFTKKLAPGVGLAEDPGTSKSFGQSRSATVARGLWSAFIAGETGALKVERLKTVLKDAGVNPGAPYLSYSQTDAYESLLSDRRRP